MFAKRVIPCLDVNRGRVVKGTNFLNLRDAGDPVERPAIEGAVARGHLRTDTVFFTGRRAGSRVERTGASVGTKAELEPKKQPDPPKPVDLKTLYAEFTDTFPFPITISSGDIGGPSAGLMWALGLYELMTPGDLLAFFEDEARRPATPPAPGAPVTARSAAAS